MTAKGTINREALRQWAERRIHDLKQQQHHHATTGRPDERELKRRQLLGRILELDHLTSLLSETPQGWPQDGNPQNGDNDE